MTIGKALGKVTVCVINLNHLLCIVDLTYGENILVSITRTKKMYSPCSDLIYCSVARSFIQVGLPNTEKYSIVNVFGLQPAW